MIREGRTRLQQIRHKTDELNGLLWSALLTDDERAAQNSLQSATTLALEVARELLEVTGGNEYAMNNWLAAAPSSSTDQS